MDGGPGTHEREDHDVDYLRLTPLHRSWRPWKRKADRERGYKHTGASNLRPGEENVVYVRRQRFHIPWWRRFLGGLIALGLVIVAAGTVFVLTARHRTTEVTLADVVGRFEATKASDLEPEQATAGAPADPGRPEVGTSATRPVVSEEPPVVADTARAVEQDGIALPAEGVYTYKTDGRESVSLFGASHEYPSESYATIRHLGGCKWQARLDIIEEHVDIVDFCNDGEQMLQSRQERHIEFFETRDGEAIEFVPPMALVTIGEKVGSVVKVSATGDKDTTGKVKRTFVGPKTLVVGNERVDVVEIHLETVLTGRSRGTSDDRFWISPLDGAIVKYERHVDTYSKAFGADVHYVEDVVFELVSLTPQR